MGFRSILRLTNERVMGVRGYIELCFIFAIYPLQSASARLLTASPKTSYEKSSEKTKKRLIWQNNFIGLVGFENNENNVANFAHYN